MMKMPVLRDIGRKRTVAESTVVIEYLDAFHPGPVPLIPDDRDLAWQFRMLDRIFDQYVQVPMGKIVTDRLRPDGGRDLHGVEEAAGLLREAFAFLDQH